MSSLCSVAQPPIRDRLHCVSVHCIPHGKPACDLLMLQSVTSAHKGLAPSRLVANFTLAKGCPYWAHTLAINNWSESDKTKI